MDYKLKCGLTVGGSNAMLDNHLLITPDVLREADRLAIAEADGKGYEPSITRDSIEIAIRNVTGQRIGRQAAASSGE